MVRVLLACLGVVLLSAEAMAQDDCLTSRYDYRTGQEILDLVVTAPAIVGKQGGVETACIAEGAGGLTIAVVSLYRSSPAVRIFLERIERDRITTFGPNQLLDSTQYQREIPYDEDILMSSLSPPGNGYFYRYYFRIEFANPSDQVIFRTHDVNVWEHGLIASYPVAARAFARAMASGSLETLGIIPEGQTAHDTFGELVTVAEFFAVAIGGFAWTYYQTDSAAAAALDTFSTSFVSFVGNRTGYNLTADMVNILYGLSAAVYRDIHRNQF